MGGGTLVSMIGLDTGSDDAGGGVRPRLGGAGDLLDLRDLGVLGDRGGVDVGV